MEFNNDQSFALCPICHDDMIYDVTQLTCGHFFHNRCIKNWFENIQQQSLIDDFLCPMCKQDQTTYDPYAYVFDPEMKIDFPEYSRPISSFEPQEYSMEPLYFEPHFQQEEYSMGPRYFESYFQKEFLKSPDRSKYLKKYREESKDYTKEYSKKYYQMNREKKREQTSQYRSQNKEYYAEQVQCDHCGALISRGNLSKHKKTKSCINFNKTILN